MRKITSSSAALCAALLANPVLAETTDPAVEKQLQELRSMRQNLEQQSQDFDQRIRGAVWAIVRARASICSTRTWAK